MPTLPAGTVTFLFTDVEGSTTLLHELGADAYAEALAEHRRVIREVCRRHGGVEVDTQGDAFFVAFPTAPGAVAAAGEMTERLASGQVQVRIGLHTGTPLVTDEGYVGTDVHRVARIAAAGHGGQVLVASSTAELVEVPLTDLGQHWLKDLPAPERLYQQGDGEFPPLRTLHQSNLPIPATPFVEREREVAEVLELLAGEDVRLLTLTGPGGTGKTRLAIQAAADTAVDYEHGVWWVPLAPLRDAALVIEQVAQVLGAKREPSHHIDDKHLLLLLDNFEQVLQAGPNVAALVAACPKLDVLVTSREPLHVAGEQEYPVPPLLEAEAFELFHVRARAAVPDFSANGAVTEICRRLDNLPLAVELAAARVVALSPEQILERLDKRLPLLTRGPRNVPKRQRTLRATIEWSYELLSQGERRLFRRLAVFTGGSRLEAAEAVTEANLETLQSLVEKSLVRHTGERYWMLETIREYALERLEESGEAEELRRLHAEFCVLLAEDAEPRMRSADVLSALAEDEGNLRAALSYCAGGREPKLMLRLAGALWSFWNARDLWQEGCRWLEEAVRCDDRSSSPVRARALRGLAALTSALGDDARTRTLLDEALELYRQVGDDDGVAKCLNNLGGLAWTSEGDLERATMLFEESVVLAKRLAAERRAGPGVAVQLGNLAQLAEVRGDFVQGRRLAEESLAAARVEENDISGAEALETLAWLALFEHRYDAAAEYADEALRIVLGIGALGNADSMLIAVVLHASRRNPLDAARLVGATQGQDQRLDLPPLGEDKVYSPRFAALEQEIGRERYDTLCAEGAALSTDDVLELVVRALD
jgi:predicted ATPase